MKKIFTVYLCLLAMLIGVSRATAGTLDNAPFKILVPTSGGWLLADATAQEVAPNTSMMASLIQTNSTLRTIVIKTTLGDVTPTAAADLFAGIRESLTRPDVKNLTQADTTFVGLRARRYTYEIIQNNQDIFSETYVFIVGNAGWTVDGVGPIDQKAEVEKMLTYFQKNGR